MRAVISGSSSGIGLAIAGHLLEIHPELEVVGLSRTAGPLADHPRFSHWATDLVQLEQAQARARRFREGGGTCDLLVCAAGRGSFGPSDACQADELQDLITLNLTSTILLCNELLPALRQAQGLAVLVGSTSSRERAPLGAAYAASKAGLHRFAEYLFAETRKSGMRVLHLCPGMTSTPFYDEHRFAPKEGPEWALEPASLAELVAFFFRGPGRHTNPTHLVLEPQRVGVVKKPKPGVKSGS